MKRLIISLIVVAFVSLPIFAQDFNVPVDCKLERAEDYAKYEKDVLKCIDWLMVTPVNEQAAKRKGANAFMLKWLTGSPTVHISLNPKIVTFIDSTDLLMIFMGGWTKYSLEAKDAKNKIAGSLAGIESVIRFYTKNKTQLKKVKAVEKYIKMKEKGKLESYVKKNA